MAGLKNDGLDNTAKSASVEPNHEHDHTAKLHKDAFDYKPSVLNERAYGAAASGPVDKSHCSVGPKLTDLTIDVPNVHEKETPRNSDSFAERQATKKRDLPISNEHFRELAKKGAELLHEGTFSLPLRNALDEAFQSDKSMHSGGKHVEDLLKYVNANLCGSEFTLGRHGNNIKVIETQYGNKPPTVGLYNLDKKAWEH
ncbi:MAG: hypothetical protein P4L53_07115 [Candidatus Obscuribacterales bacterium]|nr:hypothetical protein [Candidatus Obscuribacterales bacterium]